MTQRLAGEAPSIFDAAARDRVRYTREGKARNGKRREDWQTAAETWAKGRGDCEDLAIWLVADLRISGKTGAKVVFRRSKSGAGWHALAFDGEKIRDPSSVLGMGRK